MKTSLLVIFLLLVSAQSHGQGAARTDMQRHSWAVFSQRSQTNPAQTELTFIDLLSGDRARLTTPGESFSLTANGVIFLDPLSRQVKLAKADGIIRDHPYIKLAPDASHVEWAVSPDLAHIAWSVSRAEGDGLITATWLADVAAGEIRELLVYGPRAGIRLKPLGFGAERHTLYLEAFADGSESHSPYQRRAGLFSLALTEGELFTRALPADPACLCAVGFGGGLMLRLLPNRERKGLDVEVTRLESGERQIVPALSRDGYSEGGAILVSADGKRAVYALSRIEKNASPSEIRSVLALVDIDAGRQRIASSPIPALLQPLGFTDENRAALFTTRRGDVTWKIDLEDGGLIEVADAVYLGVIGDR